MRMAWVASERSTCARKHVGAVIADWTLSTVVSIGYNGNAAGLPNACDRPEESGNCGCCHAEMNALVKAPHGAPLVLFTTLMPCPTCSKYVLNSSVKRIFYDEVKRTNGSSLLSNKVELIHLPTLRPFLIAA